MICYDQRKGAFIEYWISIDSERNFYLDELLLEGDCVHIGFGKGRVTHGRWIPSTNQVVPVVRDR